MDFVRIYMCVKDVNTEMTVESGKQTFERSKPYLSFSSSSSTLQTLNFIVMNIVFIMKIIYILISGLFLLLF